MRRRLLTMLAATTVMLTGASLVPVADASVTTTVYTRDAGVSGGRAVWVANGDRLQVCDQDADGYSVRAVLQWIGSDHYTHQFTATVSGVGHCTTVHKNIEDHRTGWVSVYLLHVGSSSSSWVGYHQRNTTT
jgi:hypothetical protein